MKSPIIGHEYVRFDGKYYCVLTDVRTVFDYDIKRIKVNGLVRKADKQSRWTPFDDAFYWEGFEKEWFHVGEYLSE